MRRDAEPSGDVLRAHPPLVGQLLERFELVGGVQALGYASTVLLAVWR
jgi:hypothetical protein